MAAARAPHARRAAHGEPGPVDWDEYAAAAHRWELITGRPAPYPTRTARTPRARTAVRRMAHGPAPCWDAADHLDLSRTAQARALGNGVMPQ